MTADVTSEIRDSLTTNQTLSAGAVSKADIAEKGFENSV